eukprot:CAMPEP_0195105654 /NCGR_PEP_ID=MMETSP0448-20130528/77337_1 /TAXON_ID=66468 /ORGANISM="Heterocapsa triquestra, Strain CCMP 448" /LENGTH=320 /DNA_ID=CAMNT_0040141737 /DNA_START=349 /DNA_END=1309 /DNA_ORIENTATION=+
MIRGAVHDAGTLIVELVPPAALPGHDDADLPVVQLVRSSYMQGHCYLAPRVNWDHALRRGPSTSGVQIVDTLDAHSMQLLQRRQVLVRMPRHHPLGRRVVPDRLALQDVAGDVLATVCEVILHNEMVMVEGLRDLEVLLQLPGVVRRREVPRQRAEPQQLRRGSSTPVDHQRVDDRGLARHANGEDRLFARLQLCVREVAARSQRNTVPRELREDAGRPPGDVQPEELHGIVQIAAVVEVVPGTVRLERGVEGHLQQLAIWQLARDLQLCQGGQAAVSIVGGAPQLRIQQHEQAQAPPSHAASPAERKGPGAGELRAALE